MIRVRCEFGGGEYIIARVCIKKYICIHICICTYIYIYVYIYNVHTYLYIYIYRRTLTFNLYARTPWELALAVLGSGA